MNDKSRKIPMPKGLSVTQARALFPRGLVQPAGSFRFSVDALLLAAFLQPGPHEQRLLDLGTGCGVVALSMLLRYPHLKATGIDIQPSLIEAAQINACSLGLEKRFAAICADIAPAESHASFGYDLVVCNPPYRKRGEGRLSQSASRQIALFEQPETLPEFCRAASLALTPSGRLGFLYAAKREHEATEALAHEGLCVSRRLWVKARENDAPMLVLLEASKAQSKECLDSFLPLHCGHGPETSRHALAAAYCPELGKK